MNDNFQYRLCPVRPSSEEEIPMCMPCGDDDEGWESIGASHIQPAMNTDGGDLIEDVVDIDDDAVVQSAKAMPEPILPSKTAVDAHNLTHWPYRSWCPHCVAARRPNSHHRRNKSSTRRTTPLIVADNCFVRDNDDKQLAKILAC